MFGGRYLLGKGYKNWTEYDPWSYHIKQYYEFYSNIYNAIMI